MSERMLGNVPEMCPHVTSADVESDSQSVMAVLNSVLLNAEALADHNKHKKYANRRFKYGALI